MPGPKVMSLGPVQFEALGFGFGDISRAQETPWVAVEVCMTWDALQWTGPKTETLTIGGVLFPESFGGLDSLEALRRAAGQGKVLMLATIDGDIRGKHVIENISEDRSLHTARALPRRNAYQIELRRYRGAGGAVSNLAALF